MSTHDTLELGAGARFDTDADLERQEYLEETNLESTQFGAGRWADEYFGSVG